jgi:HD superfamily phosphohydrolase
MSESMALLDGYPIPAPMSRCQVRAIFPQGAPALKSADGEVLLVNEEGELDVVPNCSYSTIRPATSQSNGRAGTPPPSTASTMGPPTSPQPTHHRGDAHFADDKHRPLAMCKNMLDRVHDHVALPRFIVDIIDTPEFQRLRGLRQVGSTFYLYPGATHTRFEHSIGVAHLAQAMARKLQLAQPELGITDIDILCVMAAGLCHDIGHGPFSHLFEDVVNRVFQARKAHRSWHHESMSVAMVQRVLSRADLFQYGLRQEDVEFILLCIEGKPPHEPWPANVGRGPEKRFLLDIVANKRNGIDVDKLDYFMRDSMCCYGRASVDCHISRLLNCTRVIIMDGQPQICFEEKMAQSLGDIFNLRAKLHKYAYQHRVPRVVDLMISDALMAAEPFFKVRSADGVDRTLTECVDAPDGFVKLGDWILPAIESSADDRLKPAQDILRRLGQRRLYQLAGQATFLVATDQASKEDICNQIAAYLPSELRDQIHPSIGVDFTMITYGSKDPITGRPDDPVSHVSFYNPKSNPNVAFRLPLARQSPLFSPSDFAEKTVLVVVRDGAYRDSVMGAFAAWKARYRAILTTTVPTFNSPATGKRQRSGMSLDRSDTRKVHRNESAAVQDPCS